MIDIKLTDEQYERLLAKCSADSKPCARILKAAEALDKDGFNEEENSMSKEITGLSGSYVGDYNMLMEKVHQLQDREESLLKQLADKERIIKILIESGNLTEEALLKASELVGCK